jgi:hypothetical protein
MWRAKTLSRPLLILATLATPGAPPLVTSEPFAASATASHTAGATVQGLRTIWVDAEDGATISPDGRLVAHPDGRQVVYVDGVSQAELRLMIGTGSTEQDPRRARRP